MFLINAAATTVAILIVLAIYFWLERQELRSTWGDVRYGLWMHLARAGLLRLKEPPDPKNWRPHLLVLSGAPTRRWHLIDLATSLTHNRALLTVSTVLPEHVSTVRVRKMETAIGDYLRRRGVRSLVRVAAAPNPFEGSIRLVETYGLGALVPNTVLLGDSERDDLRAAYCAMIAHFYHAQRNTAIIRYDNERGFGKRQRIDVWWGGLKKNGSLMMILSYLLRTSLSWRSAEVRVKMVVPDESAAAEAYQNLDHILDRIRTGAVPEVLVAGGRSFDEILHTASEDADLVFLGLAEPDSPAIKGDYVAYYERMQHRLAGLPTTVLVLAAEDLAFGEVLMEQDELLTNTDT
jgi:hypothetical protein